MMFSTYSNKALQQSGIASDVHKSISPLISRKIRIESKELIFYFLHNKITATDDIYIYIFPAPKLLH